MGRERMNGDQLKGRMIVQFDQNLGPKAKKILFFFVCVVLLIIVTDFWYNYIGAHEIIYLVPANQ